MKGKADDMMARQNSGAAASTEVDALNSILNNINVQTKNYGNIAN